MFDTGVSTGGSAAALMRAPTSGVPGAHDGDACVAGLSTFAARCRVTENVARAKTVETVCEIAELRLSEAEHGGGDANEVMREVVSEVAAVLSLSQKMAGPLLEVGLDLQRLPLTALRFVFGSLDWAMVQVLASVLGKACDETIAALEFDAVAAADEMNPRSLRIRLWRMWFRFDRDEATAAKVAALKGERGVTIAPHHDGTTRLTAALSDLEGAEAESLIVEMCATVCNKDPRTHKALRADALVALLHGEHALECRCDLAEECPQYGVVDAPTPRRGHLLQILVDVQTLLGLTSEPAVLADGTPLDAETVRIVAEDAQWQGLLTELLAVLNSRAVPSESHRTGPEGARRDDDESTLDDSADTNDSGDTNDSAGNVPAAVQAPRLIGRGRIRPAGTVPRMGRCTSVRLERPDAATGFGSTSEAVRAQTKALLLAAIERDPTLADGIHPDGHGGHLSPPQGALTYRPSSDVAARVRMTYRSCTHPGCDIPSTRCELDHIVPFDHDDPLRGGWSIEANLHPACKNHHQLKTSKAWTVAMIDGGAIVWTSRAGIRAITLPELGCPTTPRPVKRSRPQRDPDPDAPPWWKEETWWEKHMPADATPPSRTDLRTAESDAARVRMRTIRRRFREHRVAEWFRDRYRPAPF